MQGWLWYQKKKRKRERRLGKWWKNAYNYLFAYNFYFKHILSPPLLALQHSFNPPPSRALEGWLAGWWCSCLSSPSTNTHRGSFRFCRQVYSHCLSLSLFISQEDEDDEMRDHRRRRDMTRSTSTNQLFVKLVPQGISVGMEKIMKRPSTTRNGMWWDGMSEEGNNN